MDLNLASLGADIGIVVGIIFLCQMIKRGFKGSKIEPKLKRFFVFLPLVLSTVAAAVVTKPMVLQDYFFNIILYTGTSSWLHNGKKLFLKQGETK